MYAEPKMEKLTINLPPMDLARMDILVDGGFYPSRTEFIRAAIRTQLDTHQDYIQKQMLSVTEVFEEELPEEELETHIYGVGVFNLDKEVFERTMKQGKLMKINVVGLLRIAKDVTPKHVEATVASVKVYGILRAPPKVKVVLQRLMEEEAGA
ncbi:MAG: CopG family transcriptional regulator [Candidatus Hermodarchaeota archaeon]|nr:CopG family transcriptional regulator [Candidatus Hermodarchaeota archaeon]